MVADSVPSTLFLLMSNYWNDFILPISSRIGPMSYLKKSNSFVSSLKLRTELGFGPVNKLVAKSSCCRLANSPSSNEIEPVTLLPKRNMILSLMSFPTSGWTLSVSKLYYIWNLMSCG